MASSRSEKVPATAKTYQGANVYNNFDTDNSVMYTYTPDAPGVARTKVTTYAGRVRSGDFKWTFNNAADDTLAVVNAPLKAAIVGYKTNLVYIQGEGAPPTTSIASRQVTDVDPVRYDFASRRLLVTEGWTLQSTELFALNGYRVLQVAGSEPVDLSGIRLGLYVARIRTTRGVFEKRILLQN